MRLGLLILVAVLLIPSALAYTTTIEYIPALYVADLGASHPVNNLTIESDTTFINGTWVILGTDNQQLFTLLDTRRYVNFAAGVQQQFNFSNVASFRYYYLTFYEGPPVGSTLEIHLNESAPPQTPKEVFKKEFNFTMGRDPMVEVFDFSLSPPTGAIANYSMMTNQTFVVGATWYLFGANSITLGDSAATPTLLDTQTAVTFTAGTWQFFDISAFPTYNYYILYVKSGFSTIGTRIEIRFNSPLPTVTPLENDLTIGATSGETWIEYSWNSTDNVSAYVDGRFYANTSLDSLILDGLNPMEEHKLALYNASNLSSIRGTRSASTHVPATTVYTFSGIAIVLIIVSMVLLGGWISSIAALFSGITSMVIGVLVSGYWQVYSGALYIVAVVAACIVVWNLYSMRTRRSI